MGGLIQGWFVIYKKYDARPNLFLRTIFKTLLNIYDGVFYWNSFFCEKSSSSMFGRISNTPLHKVRILSILEGDNEERKRNTQNKHMWIAKLFLRNWLRALEQVTPFNYSHKKVLPYILDWVCNVSPWQQVKKEPIKQQSISNWSLGQLIV